MIPYLCRSPGTKARPLSISERTPARVMSLAGEAERAAGGLAQAGERPDQLVLAVAGHPGDAEDLAGAHVERDGAHRLVPAVVLHLEVRRPRARRRPGVDSPRSTVRLTSRPTIRLARSSSSVSDGSRVPTTLPRRMTVIRSAISRTSYSLWLMKMTEVASSRVELAEDREDLARLLGREDGGRLVEDEDVRVAVQGLEDLDALLPAHRQGADLGSGSTSNPNVLAELANSHVRRAAIDEDRARHRLVAEEDVLGDGQHGDQHEVLVDHADAAGDGVGRAVDRDRRRRSIRISPSSGTASP